MLTYHSSKHDTFLQNFRDSSFTRRVAASGKKFKYGLDVMLAHHAQL